MASRLSTSFSSFRLASRQIMGCLLVLCVVLHSTAVAQDKETRPKKLSDEELTELQTETNALFAAGKYKEAFKKCSTLVDQKPIRVRNQFLLGEIGFAAGEMDASVKAFDATMTLDPRSGPRLWQRGLALYYADRFEDGVKQFESHQTVNSQDVENAVWHLLCAARVSDVETARKKLIPISRDSRVPMAEIYELFAGRAKVEDVIKASEKTTEFVKEDSMNYRLQQYFAHLYIGLYHEMMNKPDLAKASLEQAVKVNPLSKVNFMGQVARVHLELRAQQAKQK